MSSNSMDHARRRECDLADISNSGAKIVVQSGQTIPKRFAMIITTHGDAKVCELVWRNGRMAGAEFVR